MATSAERTLRVVIAGDAKAALKAFAETEVGAESLGGKFTQLGKVAAAGMAVGAAAVVGAGIALFKLGENFDEQYDKIRTATGATGEALQGLETDFKNVLSNVPSSFGDVGDTIAKLNVTLGLAGPQLDALAVQFLDLAHITKTDVAGNIDAATGAINQWGVVADQQPRFLDELFRVTQKTGISFADLTSQLADAGPVLRAAGVDWEQGAALIGLLAKNGLSASDVLPAMSKSLALAAKEGKSANVVFTETFDAIKNAPDDVTAAGEALRVFGAKAGPKFAQLIREGTVSYEDLVFAMQTGSDTIVQTASDTADFGEKWDKLKNKLAVAFEPAANAVFDGIGNALDWLQPKLDTFTAWVNDNMPKWKQQFKEWRDDFITGWGIVTKWFDDKVEDFKAGWARFMRGWNVVTEFFARKFDDFQVGWAKFANGFDKVKNFIIDTIHTIGDGLDKEWQIIKPIVDAITAAWDTLSKIPGSVANPASGSPLGLLGQIPGSPLGLFGFAEGGVVPGPIGAPVPAIVHGGERVLTPEQQRGGMGDSHYHFHGVPIETALRQASNLEAYKVLVH